MILCVCHNISESDIVDNPKLKSAIGTNCGKCLAGTTEVVRQPSKLCSESSNLSIRSKFDEYVLKNYASYKDFEVAMEQPFDRYFGRSLEEGNLKEYLRNMILQNRIHARNLYPGDIPKQIKFEEPSWNE